VLLPASPYIRTGGPPERAGPRFLRLAFTSISSRCFRSEACLDRSAFAGGMFGARIAFDRFDGCDAIGVARFGPSVGTGCVSIGLLVRLFAIPPFASTMRPKPQPFSIVQVPQRLDRSSPNERGPAGSPSVNKAFR
jgi:hypothetical protein